MKQTVFQCVTALICVIAVAITSVVCVGKIGDAKVEAAKASASAVSVDASADPSVDPSTDEPSVDEPSATDEPSVDEPTADEPSTDEPSAEDPTAAPSSSSSSSTAKPSSSSTASKIPSSKADIAAYYNAAVNKAVNQKAGFSKKRVTSLSNLDGGALLKMDIVVNEVNKFLGVGTTEYKNTKGKVGEIGKASLTANDLTAATCKQSGDNYVITLTLKNGSSKADGSGASDTNAINRTGLYCGSGDKIAFDYKSASNIHTGINNIDNGSVEAVSETNSNIKITATVNAKTGNIVSLNISYDWHVDMTKVKYIVTIKTAAGDAKTSVAFSNFAF